MLRRSKVEPPETVERVSDVILFPLPRDDPYREINHPVSAVSLGIHGCGSGGQAILNAQEDNGFDQCFSCGTFEARALG